MFTITNYDLTFQNPKETANKQIMREIERTPYNHTSAPFPSSLFFICFLLFNEHLVPPVPAFPKAPFSFKMTCSIGTFYYSLPENGYLQSPHSPGTTMQLSGVRSTIELIARIHAATKHPT